MSTRIIAQRHEISTYVPRSLGALLIRWSLVCLVSAGPSLFCGMISIGQYQLLAMLNGIAVFIAAYAWVDYKTQHHDWRQDRITRNTLVFGYTTRVMVSILFPLGMYLDATCGSLSINIVSELLPLAANYELSNYEMSHGYFESYQWAYYAIFLTTIIQGIILNFILFLFMVVVYGIQHLFRSLFRS